ncbi:MAG: RNase H family protein [Candidatus Brocadiaceae bacterium]
MTKSHVTIFVDASYNPGRKLGVGGFLCIPNCPDELLANKNVVEELYDPSAVKTRVVEHTTNTRLELQALLWALESLKSDNETKTSGKTGSITIYTDCHTAVDLLRRRERLGSVHYLSKRKGTTLRNADIYKSIFALYDELSPKLVWIKGHTRGKDRVGIQGIFSEVDKLVRNQLRSYIARSCDD